MEPLFVITDTIEVSRKAKDQGETRTDYTSHVTTSMINIVIVLSVISYSLDMSLTNSTQ